MRRCAARARKRFCLPELGPTPMVPPLRMHLEHVHAHRLSHKHIICGLRPRQPGESPDRARSYRSGAISFFIWLVLADPKVKAGSTSVPSARFPAQVCQESLRTAQMAESRAQRRAARGGRFVSVLHRTAQNSPSAIWHHFRPSGPFGAIPGVLAWWTVLSKLSAIQINMRPPPAPAR